MGGSRLDSVASKLKALPTALPVGPKAGRDAKTQASTALSAGIRDSERYSLSDTNVGDSFYRKARFVERIELENIRACERVDLRTSLGKDGAGRWLVLLGENGSGKSSVLQALGCVPDHTGWFTRRLSKGLKASTAGRQLILENGNSRIRFKQR